MSGERVLRERLCDLYQETLHELNAAESNGAAGAICYRAMRRLLALAERASCLFPDFQGDTCDFWVKTYGQEPCDTCRPWQP